MTCRSPRRSARLRNSLARLVSSGKYLGPRRLAQKLARAMPEPLHRAARKMEEYTRGWVTGGTLFEELGFYYVGPVDGHNVEALVEVLENVRDAEEGPILVHAVTKKGKGYGPAENAADKYHGVVKFDIVSGKQDKGPGGGPPAYTAVFAEALKAEMARDEKIVAITAAMPSGTGLDKVEAAFPDRTFDVGIAEQHAVTFAGGLAAQGHRPFCAIYSTFLQRAYDQVVHDVAIQNLPVRFAMDRAGLVGADGCTHAGSFDLAYLCTLPNFVVMAAADEAELVHMVHTMALHDSGPIAVRYPRGNGRGVSLPEVPQRAGDRQGPDRPRGQGGRDPVARHAAGGGGEGRRHARGQGAVDHRRRPALRQAARRGADPQAADHPRSRGDDRGSLDRRASAPMC